MGRAETRATTTRRQERRLRQCDFCDKTFSKKEHHARHVRTHTSERPFACARCSATFARNDTLLRHVRGHHADEPDGILQDSAASQPLVEEQQHSSIQFNDTAPQQSPKSPLPALARPSGGGGGDVLSGYVVKAEAALLPGTEAEAADGDPSWSADLSLIDDLSFAPVNDYDHEWHWPDALSLDSTFDFSQLGTFHVDQAGPSLPWLPLQPLPPNEALTARPSAASDEEHGRRRYTSPQPPALNVSGLWFTQIPPSPSTLAAPADPTSDRDEISRAALASSIRRHVPETTLPPTSFLNRCIKLYTARLWPVAPVIHLPTFHPSTTNPLLLLSICSFGALASAAPEAQDYAVRLFEAVHKAILVTNDVANLKDPNSLAIFQACVIGQTFAMLSGTAKHLLMARSFHGNLCIMLEAFQHEMRQLDSSVCQQSDTLRQLDSGSGEEVLTSLHHEWTRWIREQTIIRIMDVVRVHDGELAATTHNLPTLRTEWQDRSLGAPDHVFLAKTAQQWQQAVQNRTPLVASPSAQCPSGSNSENTSPFIFSYYVVLEAILSEIIDARRTSLRSTVTSRDVGLLQGPLYAWPTQVDLSSKTVGHSQRGSIHMLWHACCTHLLCDIDELEKACGRDGPEASAAALSKARAWVATDAARRSVVHSLLFLILLEQRLISDVPGLPIARSIFQAGIVLAIYSMLSNYNKQSSDSGQMVRDVLRAFPETKGFFNDGASVMHRDSDLATLMQDYRGTETCIASAYSILAHLHHLGPWPNARRFAQTLEAVLQRIDT